MSIDDLGADAAAVDSARSAEAVPQLPHAIPTIEQMRVTYDKFCAAVDGKALTLATIYAAVCADYIEKLLKVLESGDYALVSKADREKALDRMYFASMCDDNDDEKGANEAEAEARTALQLPEVETAPSASAEEIAGLS